MYRLCANLSVLSDSEYESDEQPECIPLIISRGPTIALTQRGAPGTILSTAPAGARWFGQAAGVGVSPQPDLNFGLSDIAGLAGLDIFGALGNLIYANPSLGGFTSLSLAVTATSSGARFPDGREYAAVLSDALGNASTGYFNFDATPPEVRIGDINLGPGGELGSGGRFFTNFLLDLS